MAGGIYYIINLINNNYYIGSCVNFYKRQKKHFSELAKGIHANPHLQAAYNLYGADAFIFVEQEACSTEDLLKNEQCHIDKADRTKLYNIRLVAHSNLGLQMSEQTKQKMSQKALGRQFTDQHKENISKSKQGFAPMKGRKFSNEHKQKIFDSVRRRTYCPELDVSFKSLTEAATFFKVSIATVSLALSKGRKIARQYSLMAGE